MISFLLVLFISFSILFLLTTLLALLWRLLLLLGLSLVLLLRLFFGLLFLDFLHDFHQVFADFVTVLTIFLFFDIDLVCFLLI